MPSHEEFMTAFNTDQGQHDYEIAGHLGSGGFSEVFLANDLAHQRPVALKFIRLDEHTHASKEQQLENFSNEARRVRALRHHNIVAVEWHDTYKQAGERYPYLVMEYVNGGTLKNRREMQGGRLPAEETVALLGQVMLGVKHAHDKKILHRDLKPDNILIATDQEVTQIAGFPDMAPYGVAKVTDFGAATNAHTNQHTVTETQQIVGTYPYMAPEHFEGRAVLASDVYSLAIILYEQLSGKRPIGNDRLMHLQWWPAHKSQTPAILETVMGRDMNHLIEAIEVSIMRGMAKEVEDRYRTMGDFFEDFSQQVRAGLARMQHSGVTVDMAAPTVDNGPRALPGVQPGAVTLGPAGPDTDGPEGLTHLLTKAGTTPNLTRQIPPGQRLLSRRRLLAIGSALAVGGGWVGVKFLPRAEEEAEHQRQAVAGVAKEVLGQLHKDGKLEEMFKLMGYLVPYDPAFVAKRLAAFRGEKPLSWPVLAKLSFYAPEAAEKEIHAWAQNGVTELQGLAATPFAAIADVPGHPHAGIAARTRDFVIKGLADQGFWRSYHMMYAVSENISVTNTDTGETTTGEEIWRELAGDSAYSYDKLNAISMAVTPHNSRLLTRYAQTYASWLKNTWAGGIAFDIFRHSYAGLAAINPPAVRTQLESMTGPDSGLPSGLADELAPEVALELAPYDADAAARHIREYDHLELASGLVAVALAASRPDAVQEIVGKTGEPLKSWMRLALNPLDSSLAKTAVVRLIEDREFLAEHGAHYAAALLLSRTKNSTF